MTPADVVAAKGTDDQAAAAAATASGNARRPAEAVAVDPRLLMAACRGNSYELREGLLLHKDVDVEAGSASLLPRVTMEGDTVLHMVAACVNDVDQFLDCVKVIVLDIVEKKKGSASASDDASARRLIRRLTLEALRLALEARNDKGDTPLHCAASAGNARMITCLVGLMADTADGDEDVAELKKGFVSMQNECGETALHHAVRAPHTNTACIDELMKHHEDLACVLQKDGTSPLYLAISLGKDKIAEHLYYRESRGKLSYSGPDGRNVLHAAVPRGQALDTILGWLIKEDEAAARGSSVPAAAADCLLTQLTSQRDRQQKGSTPLHLAASLSGWPRTLSPFRRSPQVWAGGGARSTLLLNANESVAYQADDEGSYPIHVAAWSNSIVVKVLLERCPDCATLRDGKGRTFLHVAAEKERLGVFRSVCGQMPQRLLSMILNAQDSNGDTVLHYAVRAGNLAVFNCLFRNRQVCLDVANKDGMTPLDLTWTLIPSWSYYLPNPRCIVRASLLAGGAPHGGGRPELFTEKHIRKRDVDKVYKQCTEATQVMSIVTALIATVTFASAFTLPGGYRSDGEPVLAGSYAFDAFIVADTLAFICSMAATYFLVYTGVTGADISIRLRYYTISAVLMRSAARSLVAAFGLGLYLVVHNTASAIAACAMVFASSIYGHMEVWRIICMARTVYARIGTRRHWVVVYTTLIFVLVLVHFWSYVIIFGLPAIRKRVH